MTVFTPPQTSFPVPAFEQLLPALSNVLKAVHDGGDSDEPQHRLAIAAATDDLKRLIADAKVLIEGLPGGEMLVEDQDEVIASLERLKQQRESHLQQFARQEFKPSGGTTASSHAVVALSPKTEVDSEMK